MEIKLEIEEFKKFLGLDNFNFEEVKEFKRFDLFRYSLYRAMGLVIIQDSIQNLRERDEAEVEKTLGPIMKLIERGAKKMGHNFNKKEINLKKFMETSEPFIELMISLQIFEKKPLYSEAVVSSVTAFEAFLKGSNEYLNEFRDVRLLKKTSNLEIVDETFRNAFGIEESDWSVFSSENARSKLQEFIWLRNLVVHRGGIVDSRFKKYTNCSEEIGEEIEIKREYIEEMMKEMFYAASRIEEIKMVEEEAMT